MAFEDLEVWKQSRLLVNQVYSVSRETLLAKDFGLKDQIQRASVSVMANIAEGYERDSPREYRHFLKIAKGSCGEVRSLMYIIEDAGYLPSAHGQAIRNQATSVSKMLHSLINKINV